MYTNSLLVYSDMDLDQSHISDETAHKIVSYMNDNDFFDHRDGPLECHLYDGQTLPWYAERFVGDHDSKVLEFSAYNDVEFTLENDIREMAVLFPDLIFELTVHYLDGDEYYKFYYKNDRRKVCCGWVSVEYDDPNDVPWEPSVNA